MPPCCRPEPSQVILSLATPQVGHDAGGAGEGEGDGSDVARTCVLLARCLCVEAGRGQMVEVKTAAMLPAELRGGGGDVPPRDARCHPSLGSAP